MPKLIKPFSMIRKDITEDEKYKIIKWTSEWRKARETIINIIKGSKYEQKFNKKYIKLWKYTRHNLNICCEIDFYSVTGFLFAYIASTFKLVDSFEYAVELYKAGLFPVKINEQWHINTKDGKKHPRHWGGYCNNTRINDYTDERWRF